MISPTKGMWPLFLSRTTSLTKSLTCMLNQKNKKNHNNSTQLIIVNLGAHYVDLMFRWKFCVHTNAFTEIHLSHCQFSGFSFTFIFCYFGLRFSTLHNLLPNFFVKSQCSVLKIFHFTKKKSIFFQIFFPTFFSKNLNCFFWQQSAWKCI